MSPRKATPMKVTSMMLTGALLASSWSGVPLSNEKVYAESNLLLEEYFNDTVTVDAEAGLIYEAEDAVLEGVIIDNKHTGYTGTGFTDYKPNAPGGYLEWTVNVPIEGEYMLVFRYGNGASENRPAEIKVNDAVVEKELAFNSTGEWNSWQVTSTTTNLKAGKNIIRATATGASGGGNIDHLRICSPSLIADDMNAPSEINRVEASEIVGDILGKKLESEGLLVQDEYFAAEHQLTRVEFMNLINNLSGFSKEEVFKNLEIKSNIWEVSNQEWYAYVLEAAKEAGYIKGKADGTVDPKKVVTKQEAAVMVGRLLNLNLDEEAVKNLSDTNEIDNWSKGYVGAVIANGYMATESDGSFGPEEGLTRSEAMALADKIIEMKGQPSGEVHVASVDAVSSNVVLVTLDGVFNEVDLYDIMISTPNNSWEALAPNFKHLQIAKGAVGKNMFGNTVLVYELVEQLDKNAGYKIEEEPTVFAGDIEAMTEEALNLVSWQMDHGGWTKSMDDQYKTKWDGVAKRSGQLGPNGEELGSIDNDATIKQIRYIAEVYRENNMDELKASLEKGIDFLLTMQYPTGGFPQVYPKRDNYSDYATYNDNAMINVLNLYDDIMNKKYPFDQPIIDEKYNSLIQASLDKAVDYILKSQIEVDGKLTAWCAQHDPVSYEAQHARSYEHPSISGMESVGIIKFLMSRPNQTEEIKKSIKAALEWYDKVKLEGIRYVSADPNKEFFVEDDKATTWYRFYEIGTNTPIFSGRDGVIKHKIQEIEEERQNGYSWGGSYAAGLMKVAKATGFYEGKVYAEVVNDQSKDMYGRTLKVGEVKMVDNLVSDLSKKVTRITVGKDNKADYNTVQAAIDAVPSNNVYPIEIFIKNGTYKEEIVVPSDKPFITMIGESKEGTILTYDNYAGKEKPTRGTYGTTGSSSVFLHANDFRAENITFENSFNESLIEGSGKQAVAVYAAGERQSFINCKFIGNQDTLYTRKGSQYFYQSYIEGDVDFIFGEAQAVFEDCDIVSLDRGSDTNNGYVTAASTQISKPYGYLFINSRLTSDAAPGTVHLGRPWHPGGDVNAIASVVFKNSYLGDHINPEGWTDMSGFKAEDARFYEYQNEGPGAIEHSRGKQLTEEEAAQYTIENVLGGWNPKAN